MTTSHVICVIESPVAARGRDPERIRRQSEAIGHRPRVDFEGPFGHAAWREFAKSRGPSALLPERRLLHPEHVVIRPDDDALALVRGHEHVATFALSVQLEA
jgi:hypothetical protein